MAREINPKDTKRAKAYELWLGAPNPMVTFFKTLDVTNLVKISEKKNLKFNMLMDFCIGKAASAVKEFYMLPVGEKLMQYDTLAVNTIVKNKDGEVSSCECDSKDEIALFSNTAKFAVARKTNHANTFGASFDTVADFIFLTVALIKLFPILHIACGYGCGDLQLQLLRSAIVIRTNLCG